MIANLIKKMQSNIRKKRESRQIAKDFAYEILNESKDTTFVGFYRGGSPKDEVIEAYESGKYTFQPFIIGLDSIDSFIPKELRPIRGVDRVDYAHMWLLAKKMGAEKVYAHRFQELHTGNMYKDTYYTCLAYAVIPKEKEELKLSAIPHHTNIDREKFQREEIHASGVAAYIDFEQGAQEALDNLLIKAENKGAKLITNIVVEPEEIKKNFTTFNSYGIILKPR